MSGYLKQKMTVVAVLLAAAAVSYGYPMPDQGKNLISGVFIPSDAFKNLQDRANGNMQSMQPQNQGNMGQPATNPQPTYQPANNQPQYQYQQPPVMTNQQPRPDNTNVMPMNTQPLTNQPMTTQPMSNQPMTSQPMTAQPMNNQPTMMQPVLTNQPTVLYAQPMTANRDPNSNQPIVMMTNQPNQPNNQQPQIFYVQQPSNQPVYVQPNQPNQYVLSNGQSNQPTQIVIANPSNGSPMQGTMVSTPSQTQPGTVYTLIPLTTQNNGNTNTGSYLIPVQNGNGNANPIILSAAH